MLRVAALCRSEAASTSKVRQQVIPPIRQCRSVASAVQHVRPVRWIVLIALLLTPRAAQTQQRWIKAMSDRNVPVAGAVFTTGGSTRPLTTDREGHVALPESEMTGTIRIRALGFRALSVSADSLRLNVAPNDTIRITLTALAELLGVVEVSTDRPALGGARITRDVARRLPPLGEPDILRVLPLIGGIAQPNDIRPRLYLAGAAGDESLVTLDGHPLQHGLHFDGLLGAFNLAALDRADVMMHQVSASKRSRVGGVIALETRTAETQPHGELGVSLAAANATVTAPIGSARTLVSARSTWTSSLLERVLSDNTPGFRDGLVRVGMPLGSHAEATVLGFGAYNAPRTLVNGVRSGLETHEALAGATLRARGLGLDWSMRASRSRFRTQRVMQGEASGVPEALQRWDAASIDATARRERRWLDVHASLDTRRHEYAWNRGRIDNPLLPTPFSQQSRQQLLHAAIAGGSTVGRVAFDGGARLTRSNDGVYVAPQLNAEWRASPQIGVGASLARRWQFDSQYGEPQVAGDPPPVFLFDRPRRMDAGALTLAFNGAAMSQPRDARVEITTFVRSFADRTVPTSNIGPSGSVELVDGQLQFARTSGRAYGVSTTMSGRSASGASLQVAYTWQRAWQRDSAADVRAAWDIPHTLSTLASVPIGRRFELSSVVSWRSGTVVTPVNGAMLYPVGGNQSFRTRFGELNSARLPDYVRVDAMFRWRGRIASADAALTFQLINLLARDNVMGIRLDGLASLPEGARLPPQTGVPFLPSLGMELRW